MRVTSIVENTSAKGLPVEHGLSLHIMLEDGRSVLFDMGQGALFADNAERLGLDVKAVDVAVISHGHYDHGGGLETFLDINKKAPVYIHEDAFQLHYSLRETGLRYIGLDEGLKDHERLIKCGNKKSINSDMMLYANVQGDCCNPVGNRLLYGPKKTLNDDFHHEQNLIIREGDNVVLFAGCAHRGIVNIIRNAEAHVGMAPTHVFAGMHLVKSGLSETDENNFIAELAGELQRYPQCKYYTMHCTGVEQFSKLKAIMGQQIDYLSCGDIINIM